MRLIDADAIHYVEIGKGVEIALASDIDKIPTVSHDDVGGVVLCQDCDCWNEWDHAGRKSLGNYVCSCAHWTVEDGAVLYTKPTDFCSYGERKVSEDA